MKKNTLLIAVAVMAAVLVFTSVLCAQEGRGAGRLRGVVYDKDKNPIEGVKLTLEFVKYTNKLESFTNSSGQFAFLGLAMGQVKITAEKEGYISTGIQTDVSGAKTNPVQYITMEKIGESASPGQGDGEKAKDIFMSAGELYKTGQFKAAHDLYVQFRESQPNMFRIGINIGNCLLNLQQYDEAIKEFNIVLEKMKAETPDLKGNVQAAQMLASIGDVYMRQNKLAQAESYFKQSIDIDKSDHALAYNVGEILFQAGKTDEAIKYYEIAIAISPAWAKAYRQSGYAYLNKGDTETAKKLFKKYIELAPADPEAETIKEVLKSL